MSKALVDTLSELYRFIFLGTCAVVPFLVTVIYCRIYGVYKKMGRPAKELGFFLFSFRFQLPSFSKGMLSYREMEELPNSPQSDIANARRQINLAKLSFLFWIILVLIFGAAVATLRRHTA